MITQVYEASAQAFDIQVTSDQVQDAVVTIGAFGILDDVLDTMPFGQLLHNRQLDALQNGHPEQLLPSDRLTQYAARFDTWDPDKQTAHIEVFRSLAWLAEQKRIADNVTDLVHISAQEGEETARLFHMRHPDPRVQRFNEFFTQAGICANLFDAMADMRHDYRSGDTAVPPTAINRIELARQTLPHAKRLHKAASQGELMRPRVLASIVLLSASYLLRGHTIPTDQAELHVPTFEHYPEPSPELVNALRLSSI